MKRKIVAVWVSLAMLFGLVVIVDVVTDITPPVKAATITVDDSGGADYLTIQEGIDAANPGDTIFVYSGTYNENVIVNKMINLTGENNDTTIIDAGGIKDVIRVFNNWVNITGFTIRYSGSSDNRGIWLNSVQNCWIYNNILTNNYNGIHSSFSFQNNISGNTIFLNNNYGIFIVSSNWNNISKNNLFSNNEYGIYLQSSNNNNITENSIQNNGYGIGIYSSSYGNIIKDNIVSSNNGNGIRIDSSDENIIVKNNVTPNNDYAIHLQYSDNNNIIYNNVSNNNAGIYIFNSDWNDIINNSASHNTLSGIMIRGSDNNKIINNTAFYNEANGISLYSSNWNTIKCNYLSYSRYGIYFDSSLYNNITNNIMIQDGIYITGNSLDHWNTHNINASNKVNYKPLYYLKNQINGTVPSDAGQVILANCTNVTVENLNLLYCSVGIVCGYSSNNSITGNNVSHNYAGIFLSYSIYNNVTDNNASFNSRDGIHLYSSNWNLLKGNFISNTYYSIYFISSKWNQIINNIVTNNDYGPSFWTFSNNNLMYHNSFINNIHQAVDGDINFWDNGYPIGGNYWSVYSGADFYKGPNQDIPGKDFVGDSSYEIDPTTFDNYPLMRPYTSYENYTTLMQGWNLISIPLVQVERNITRVLGSIDSWYDSVQWYDSLDSNDSWKHHKVGKSFGNDLFELNETMGFWIHITNPGDTIFLFNGTQPTINQSITLYPGWNLVGYPSLTNRTRDNALNNINFGSDVDAIWTYNATTQTWKEITALDNFELGRGYWIHSKVTKVWDVPL